MSIGDEKRIFSKNLNYYLRSHQKTQKEVAEKLGISLSTFSSWCTGNKMPRMGKIQALADYFGIQKSDLIEDKPATSISELTKRIYPDWHPGEPIPTSEDGQWNATLNDAEVDLIADYNKLNTKGKAKASERVKELTEVPRYIDPEADVRLSNAQPELIEIDFYELPASAGTGMYLFDEPKEVIKVADTDTARRADFVLPVSGDSMEPDYYDGDRVFVKSMPTVEIGEIGIFVVNGESYIKERGENELISHNKVRRNISLCESDTVICVGKVIGKV